MSLNLKTDPDMVIGRKYNVEFLDGRGRCCTFNNTLWNVDGTYFWISSEENGMALVRQDRVTLMYCTDKPIFDDLEHKVNKKDLSVIESYYLHNEHLRGMNHRDRMICTCNMFDLYFNNQVYDRVLTDVIFNNVSLVKKYMTVLKLKQYCDKTYKDSVFE